MMRKPTECNLKRKANGYSFPQSSGDRIYLVDLTDKVYQVVGVCLAAGILAFFKPLFQAKKLFKRDMNVLSQYSKECKRKIPDTKRKS